MIPKQPHIPARKHPDFESLYNNWLEPLLPGLAASAKRTNYWLAACIVTAAALVTGMLGYIFTWFSPPVNALLGLGGAIALGISVYRYYQQYDEYTAGFKTTIIQQMLDTIQPGLIYQPDEGISSREYKMSGLYRYEYDYFESEDYIEGTIDGISFHCSEVHTTKLIGGTRNARRKTIFHGLFMVVLVSNRFTGGTYVQPRHRGFDPGSALGHYYWQGPPPHSFEIGFSNKSFEEYFKVLSTWPAQAKEILSEDCQNSLLDTCRISHKPVSFSFVMGNCYIAIPLDTDLLEPSDTNPGDKELLRKHYNTLQLMMAVLRRLPLASLQ